MVWRRRRRQWVESRAKKAKKAPVPCGAIARRHSQLLLQQRERGCMKRRGLHSSMESQPRLLPTFCSASIHCLFRRHQCCSCFDYILHTDPRPLLFPLYLIFTNLSYIFIFTLVLLLIVLVCLMFRRWCLGGH